MQVCSMLKIEWIEEQHRPLKAAFPGLTNQIHVQAHIISTFQKNRLQQSHWEKAATVCRVQT